MEDKEYIIDFGEIAEALKENYKPILRITAGSLVLGLIFLVLAWFCFPTYHSTAMLQIKQRSGSGLFGMMASTDFLNMGTSQMESYVVILKSRGVVEPIIKATEGKNIFGNYPELEKYIEKKIVAEPVKSTLKVTDILKVTTKAKSAEEAQKLNQMLIDNFLKRVTELNSAEKGSMKFFLEERLKTAKEDLNKAEIALEKFKVDNKILSPSNNAEIFTERIMDAEKRAAANQIELEAAQARLAAINQQLSGSGSANADNVTIQKYNEELAKLESTRIAWKDKYTEKHPRMIEINERIASLKAKIQMEVDKIAALQAPSDNQVHQSLVGGKYSAEGAVTVARQKAEALQKIIDQNNADLAKMPAMEQQFVRLSRDYGVANEIYMMLTKKLEETKITEFQQPDNVLVVDPPHLPEKPAFPRKIVTLLAAMLLGFFGSCGYVVFKEINNRTIRKAETISEYMELSILGSIPSQQSLTNSFAGESDFKQLSFVNKMRDYIWKK